MLYCFALCFAVKLFKGYKFYFPFVPLLIHTHLLHTSKPFIYYNITLNYKTHSLHSLQSLLSFSFIILFYVKCSPSYCHSVKCRLRTPLAYLLLLLRKTAKDASMALLHSAFLNFKHSFTMNKKNRTKKEQGGFAPLFFFLFLS